MTDVGTEGVVGPPMVRFIDLAASTFAANSNATVAEALADGCEQIADLAAGVAGVEAPADVASLRRRAATARRHAERAGATSAAAVGALAEAAFVHPRAERPATRRQSTRRVQTAVGNTERAVEGARAAARAAGRVAAGAAALHEPSGGPEPLWDAALELLRWVPLDGDHRDEVVVTLAGGEADRRAVAGLIAHVGLNHPAILVVEVGDGRRRYVQLSSTDNPRLGTIVESVSDHYLDASHPMTDAQRHALVERGFSPPDIDHVNWHRYQDGFSVSGLADLVLATLAEAHGVVPGDDVRVSLALAAVHPDSSQEMLGLPVLDLETPACRRWAERCPPASGSRSTWSVSIPSGPRSPNPTGPTSLTWAPTATAGCSPR